MIIQFLSLLFMLRPSNHLWIIKRCERFPRDFWRDSKWFRNCGLRRWQQVIRKHNFETRCLSQFIVYWWSKIICRANPVSSQQPHQSSRYLRLQSASLVSPNAYNKSITRVISCVANRPTFILVGVQRYRSSGYPRSADSKSLVRVLAYWSSYIIDDTRRVAIGT